MLVLAMQFSRVVGEHSGAPARGRGIEGTPSKRNRERRSVHRSAQEKYIYHRAGGFKNE